MSPTAKQELQEIGRRYEVVRKQFDVFLKGLRTAVEPARPGVPPFDPIPSLSIKSTEGTTAAVEYLGNTYLLAFDSGFSGDAGVYGAIDCYKQGSGPAGQPRRISRFSLGQEGEVTIPGLPQQLKAATEALTVFRYLVQEAG